MQAIFSEFIKNYFIFCSKFNEFPETLAKIRPFYRSVSFAENHENLNFRLFSYSLVAFVLPWGAWAVTAVLVRLGNGDVSVHPAVRCEKGQPSQILKNGLLILAGMFGYSLFLNGNKLCLGDSECFHNRRKP